MSPEQAHGEAQGVGPAADIYSLGATLFTVLTNRHPAAGESVTEILERVASGAIDRPREINASVPPALEAICLKALAYVPADRYRSALDLAADIDCYLADEPTAAYREPWRDRLGRAVRRHRAAVTGLVALMLTTILALAMFNVVARKQNRLLREARDDAKANLVVARSENLRAEQNLSDLRETAFQLQATAEGVLARTPGAQAERRQMTELLVEVCERMHQQRQQDPELQRDLAQAWRIYGNLNRIFNQRDVATEFYAKSLTMLEGLVARDPASQLTRDRLAETLRERSNLHKLVGDIQRAVDDLSRAGQIATELLTDNPENSGYLRTAATIRQNLAELQVELGLTEAAQANMAFAAQSLTTLVQGPDSIPTDQPLLLLALNTQGEILRDAGQLTQSEDVFREALRQARDAMVGGDNNTQHSLARILLNLGQTLARDTTRRDESLTAIDEAIAIWTQLVEAFPATAFYQRYLAAAITARAELRIEAGELQEVTTELAQVRDRLQPLVQAAPQVVSYRETLVDVLVALAHAARADGDGDTAKSHLTAAIEQMQRSHRANTAEPPQPAEAETTAN